ncbi:MAG: hypothetical protein FI721_05795 [SAR202 cluster bacterium]|nr:hypothetical protein [SAR202 cluster bacterium]MQG36246.1 hypothetical protein [SAR202 cluster bacterium]MQG85948.1 hypothetical protein [SAR202 cluster bacterium]
MNNSPLNPHEEQIVTQPRITESGPTMVSTSDLRRTSIWEGSHIFILIAFLGFIVVGTILLLLPISNNCTLGIANCSNNNFTPFRIAFLTATSAATVTGHTAVPTAEYWSSFGHLVIFAMMTIGGLGFMTAATFILIIIGQRSTLPQRLLMRDMGFDRMQGLKRLALNIIAVVMLFYVIGFLFIWVFTTNMQSTDTPGELWNSLFLSVSAFNNAGFTINAEGASLLAKSYGLMIVVTILIILGSFGWASMVDIFRHRHFNRLTLNTKMIIMANLALWAMGAVVFFALEYQNEQTIGGIHVVDQVFSSVFHTVSGRTAGFTTINFKESTDFTKILYSILMLIGGSPGSVAGGIKTTTIAVLAAAVISSLRGRSQAEMFGREIAHFQVMRALTVTILSLIIVLVVAPTLTFIHPELPFIDVMFDVFSAYATTGSSTGIVPYLDTFTTILFSLTMVLGRLVPLYLAFSLVTERTSYRFVRERVTLG